MRLKRVGPPGAERPVVEWNGAALDVSSEFQDFDARFFRDDGMSRLRELLEERGGGLPVLELDSLRVGAPVGQPPKLVCIGLNYADHAAEAGQPVPTEPTVFFKAPNTVVGPYDPVLLPPGSTKTDWEVELAIVVGRTVRYLSDPDEALDAVAGVTISNDVSEREFQLERGGQWCKGKSFESFNPLGPALITLDEVEDVDDVALWLDVNGDRKQSGNTSDMVFSVSQVIWYLSQLMVLEPGDIINTGTPAGVGLSTGSYLGAGDEMRLGIDGLGEQHQVVSGDS